MLGEMEQGNVVPLLLLLLCQGLNPPARLCALSSLSCFPLPVLTASISSDSQFFPDFPTPAWDPSALSVHPQCCAGALRLMDSGPA